MIPRGSRVANHGKIRHQKKQGEQKPTAVAPMVGEEAESEDGGTFKMQERSRVHCVHVASTYQIDGAASGLQPVAFPKTNVGPLLRR